MLHFHRFYLFCAHLFENTVTALSLSLSLFEFAVRENKKWRKWAQMFFLSLSLSLSLRFQLHFSLSRVPLLRQRHPLLHVSMSFFFGFILFMYFIHFPLWVLIIGPCYLKILDFKALLLVLWLFWYIFLFGFSLKLSFKTKFWTYWFHYFSEQPKGLFFK